MRILYVEVQLSQITCVNNRDIPIRERLRQQMQVLSAVSGLTGLISDETLDTAEIALEVIVD